MHSVNFTAVWLLDFSICVLHFGPIVAQDERSGGQQQNRTYFISYLFLFLCFQDTVWTSFKV